MQAATPDALVIDLALPDGSGLEVAAEALRLSGIVSILFCGMVMSHYARPNCSPGAKRFSLELWHTLAVRTMSGLH